MRYGTRLFRSLNPVECSACSERGRGRRTNQDDHRLSPVWLPAPGTFLAVADGMGGAPAGEEASALALADLHRRLQEGRDWTRGPEATERLLAAAVSDVDARLRALAAADPARAGMGTTLTAALALWPRVYLAHVGDSRAYLFREGALRRLTRDHTLAERLAEYGVEGWPRRWRNFLCNIVGGGESAAQPEVSTADLRLGDVLLLCTDGLSNSVPDASIAGILGSAGSADDACRTLVRAAQDAGERDDVTVVTARFHRESPSPGSP